MTLVPCAGPSSGDRTDLSEGLRSGRHRRPPTHTWWPSPISPAKWFRPRKLILCGADPCVSRSVRRSGDARRVSRHRPRRTLEAMPAALRLLAPLLLGAVALAGCDAAAPEADRRPARGEVAREQALLPVSEPLELSGPRPSDGRASAGLAEHPGPRPPRPRGGAVPRVHRRRPRHGDPGRRRGRQPARAAGRRRTGGHRQLPGHRPPHLVDARLRVPAVPAGGGAGRRRGRPAALRLRDRRDPAHVLPLRALAGRAAGRRPGPSGPGSDRAR